jgi:hypothetical protein
MKKQTIIALVILAAAGLVFAQDTRPTTGQDVRTDQVTVPLSNPAKPARVSINTLFGAINVVGYDGKDVIITAKPREKSLKVNRGLRFVPPDAPAAPLLALRDYQRLTVVESDKEKDKEKKDKAAGMKQIPLESSGLTAEEEDNNVTIRLESFRRAYDLDIKVPVGSSLKLNGSNLDSITVENVAGEIEASTAVGDVKLVNVTGPLTVNATNGDIEVTLTKVAPDKPMSFVSFVGDIDLTLPADAKASFRIKSTMGELYSDFDIVMKSLPVEPQKATGKEAGRFRVSLERSVLGTINGGGPEFKIQNNNGSIYIRKKK